MILIKKKGKLEKKRWKKKPSARRDSNPQPLNHKAGTLPLRYNCGPTCRNFETSVMTSRKTKSSSSDSNHPSLVILAKRETRPWMTNGVSFGWLYKYVKT